jgi:hypothetical protein
MKRLFCVKATRKWGNCERVLEIFWEDLRVTILTLSGRCVSEVWRIELEIAFDAG